MPQACYIHIPFCISKCKYCSFVSFQDVNSDLTKGYVYSLLKEIDNAYSGEKLKTLYIGGGTPSLLSLELLSKIKRKFITDNITEITIEVNPDDITYDYLSGLKEIGFNRISIGSQTFSDRLLQLAGRRHNAEQVIEAVYNSKNAGLTNISLDLIYGLPTQTMKDVEADLEIVSSLSIQHISTYGLKIEGDSYWGRYNPKGVPDDDTQADMYEKIADILSKASFERYEVSNFAKKGYESRHNLTYWNNEEYYGFGVSAHGYVDGMRYSNLCTLQEYINNPLKHEYGRILSEQEKLEEEIFLGFRKTEGINIKKIKEKFNVNFEIKYKRILEKYSDYIIETPNGYAFNLKGTMLSNEILPEFLED